MNDFSNKIRRIIEDSNLTVEEFADKLGVTRNVIYNIYRGQLPSLKFIISLSNFMPEIDLNWLIKESRELDPPTIFVKEDRNPIYEDQNLLSMARKHLEALEDIIIKKKLGN